MSKFKWLIGTEQMNNVNGRSVHVITHLNVCLDDH